MSHICTIGEKEYTEQQLLEFGKAHYPKFYWIKRGIGIGIMSTFGIAAILLALFAKTYYEWYQSNHDDFFLYYSQGELVGAVVCGLFAVVGLILFSLSFIPLPDEKYIKHAIDYYTKLEARNSRNQARQDAKQEKEDVSTLLKYKQLLDAGVITQEEFDAKKKEIMK